MSILIRRSNLLVPLADERSMAAACRCNSDAVTLDLEGMPGEGGDAVSKMLVPAVEAARRSGADVFLRIDGHALKAVLAASLAPGFTGIMLPAAESADDVARVDAALAAFEHAHGLSPGSLELIVVIDTALGVWNLPAILKASARITQAALDEGRLAATMRISPVPEHDPFIYARGRLVVEAVAAGVQSLGMSYPLGLMPRVLPPEELQRMANVARNLGMKGVICPHESWVDPVNRAFTPTPELVAYNRRVRELFAAGVAAGTAAVPMDGRMIDVPVDEWAKVVLATAEACAERDARKRQAQASTGS